MDPKRVDAARAGSLFYEASPCATCGGTRRYVSAGKCCECVKARARKQYEEDAKLMREARGQGVVA